MLDYRFFVLALEMRNSVLSGRSQGGNGDLPFKITVYCVALFIDLQFIAWKVHFLDRIEDVIKS